MTASGYRRPMNLVDGQRLAALWSRRAGLISELGSFREAGDGFHVDRCLDELVAWEREYEAFMGEFGEAQRAMREDG